jgi:2'-5' RNA ligase
MRCFIAIKLDDAIKDQLENVQGLMKNIGGKVSWTSRAQMHLTLQFLGDTENDLIPQIIGVMKSAAREVPPFTFDVEKIGAFPPRGIPRILWVGVSECPPLLKLQQLIETGLKPLGFDPEERGFTPHLTLGRVREKPDLQKYQKVMAENQNFTAGRQQVNKVILFSSDLQPTGAIHTALAEVPLGE